jgi:hypothetical protein
MKAVETEGEKRREGKMPRQYPPDPFAFARLLNTNRRQPRHEPLLTLARLLKTDSKLEFASIRDALSSAGKPGNALQEVYFHEVIYFVWEFLRLQRYRPAIFKSERRPALEELLRALHFSKLGFELVPGGNETRKFVRGLPGNNSVQKRLSHLLKRVQMEDSVVDRGEIRPSFADIEMLDRMKVSAQSRIEHAVRCLARYNPDLAAQVQEITRLIVTRQIRVLDQPSKKESPVGSHHGHRAANSSKPA